MDLDILQQRLDYFTSLGYITYHHETKIHSLLPATLLVILKVYSMYHALSFPSVNAKVIASIRDEPLEVYATELGEKMFVRILKGMSTQLFEMIAPIYKGTFTPETFVVSNPRTYQNLLGTTGKSTRKKPKTKMTYHVLVDNKPPYEYLKTEYIYDTIYEARLFINQLVAYIPPSRLELWRLVYNDKGKAPKRVQMPVLITKNPYNV